MATFLSSGQAFIMVVSLSILVNTCEYYKADRAAEADRKDARDTKLSDQ